jgi:branched-chain amino acid transport system ATP-binding protein
MSETEHDPQPEPRAEGLVPEDGAEVSDADQQVASDVAAFEEAIKEGEDVQLGIRAARAQRDGAPVLELRSVSTHYGLVSVLRDVNVEIFPGEIVCLLGGNASGKTTTLKTILGMVIPSEGEVRLDGENVTGLPTTNIVAKGISMVPENRRLFGKMTVSENLDLGAYQRHDRAAIAQDFDRILTLFPRLKERLHQKAGTLSGGEQQMVAMGRALMAQPKVLLMDEPSMGLAPILVEQVFSIIKEINDVGTTIFVVEQNANMALSIADRGYVLQTGQIVLSDTAQGLLNNPQMREAYLGEL